MQHISIDKTVSDAYRFLGIHIGSIVGVIWLPIVLLFGLGVGLFFLTVPPEWYAGPVRIHDEAFFQSVSPDFWKTIAWMVAAFSLYALASLVVAATIMVGLMHHALGMKRDPTWIHFSLGMPVWRMIGAFILADLAILAMAVLSGLIVGTVSFALVLIPHVGASLVAGIVLPMILVLNLFVAYAAIRLVFFLPATVVAEERISPMRSWELSRGNFWRIIAVAILVYLPIAVVAGIAVQAIILPVLLPAVMPLSEPPTAAQIEGVVQAMMPVLPWLLGLGLALKIVLLGLVTGAMGSAYNQRVEEAPKEPV